MISSYRLGDLVLLKLNEHEQNLILKEHPHSFGSKYIIERHKNKTSSNIDIITKIVTEEIENKLHLLPEDIEYSTVIHVRIGDVVAGNKWYEKYKRPFHINYLQSLLTNDNNNKYIIGKCHFGEPSSNNYDACILFSQKYLYDVTKSLNADYFDSGDPDTDLCCAVKSKLFVQGRGYFSQLIVEIRKKLNLENIETKCVLYENPPSDISTFINNNNNNNNNNNHSAKTNFSFTTNRGQRVGIMKMNHHR